MDYKLIVKHLANGTLADNLCVVCLMPLVGFSENVYTEVCKAETQFCIADVMKTVCEIELEEKDDFKVCINCFHSASTVYKFYHEAKHSQLVINFYVDHLLNNYESLNTSTDKEKSVITLPVFTTNNIPYCHFELNAIGAQGVLQNDPGPPEMVIDDAAKQNQTQVAEELLKERTKIKTRKRKQKFDREIIDTDDNLVIVKQDTGEVAYYKVRDSNFVMLNELEAVKENLGQLVPEQKIKFKRKRDPMMHRSCPLCPVKYRFLSKLREHMKTDHNIDMYICMVCKAITVDKNEHESHLNSHTNIHQCDLCNSVFKKRSTIIAHLKMHEHSNSLRHEHQSHKVCDMCGVILENEDELRKHCKIKHSKNYTCYYCGKMYKTEVGFELHIKKHEGLRSHPSASEDKLSDKTKGKSKCTTCGKYFVDERSLLWHQRLHNNERPFACKWCGRRYVTLNRRNQHALTAHSGPTRRCPLCPALFHMTSMVNTHITRVHLNNKTRRTRSYRNSGSSRAQPVPIQELSVAVQSQLLQLRTAPKSDQTLQQNQVVKK